MPSGAVVAAHLKIAIIGRTEILYDTALRLREEGRYTQGKIESSEGSTRLASVLVDGLPRNQYLRKET